MPIRDLRKAPPDVICHTDVALIGAGPVGLTIARELSGTRIHVTVIDSGGFEADAAAQSLNVVENVGEPKSRPGAETIGRGYTDALSWLNHVRPFEVRDRGVGGSSRTWIGKCAAFDALDFEKRSWVPGSGWPVSRAALDPFFDRAASFLNLGPNLYDERLYDRLKSPPRSDLFGEAGLRPFFWQFSHAGNGGREPTRFVDIARNLDMPNIDILTYATVTRIRPTPGGGRGGILDLRTAGGKGATVHASVIVLCGGGVENARLLLASNPEGTGSIGNPHGMIGRYLADHPRTVLARFPAEEAARVGRLFTFYGLAGGERRNFYLHGLSPSPELQKREKMLNCAAYPVQQLAEDDPWRALRGLSAGLDRSTASSLLTAVGSPMLVTRGLWDRLHRRRGLPRRLTELRFDVMVEQRPNPLSRVTLSRQLDMFGMPLPKIDWRIGSQEIETVRKFSRTMSAAFVRAGLPEPLLPDWVMEEGASGVAFMDMAHPSGTTRMGTDPRTSVVDADCMIHGVEGIFVAGSSVFPTPGHANPTLTILALAMRLANHLRIYCQRTVFEPKAPARTIEPPVAKPKRRKAAAGRVRTQRPRELSL